MDITLKWLELDDIKAQCRIESDNTLEDRLLMLYGAAAEQAILNACRRTYDELIEEYWAIPYDLYLCGLLLANHLYEHRGPTTTTSISVIPYSLDMYWKPYARLADKKEKEE